MTSMTDQLDDAKDRAANGAKRATSAGRRELSNFFDDVEELIARATHTKDEDMAKIRSKVEASLLSARDATTRTAQRIQDRVTEAASSTDDYVRDRPWTMIGIAALVGLVVGVAIQRR